MRDDLRLIEAALVQSSINLTCVVLFLVIGLGIGGLKHALLNLMMKKRPPKKTPCLDYFPHISFKYIETFIHYCIGPRLPNSVFMPVVVS